MGDVSGKIIDNLATPVVDPDKYWPWRAGEVPLARTCQHMVHWCAEDTLERMEDNLFFKPGRTLFTVEHR